MKLFRLSLFLVILLSLGCQKAEDRMLAEDIAKESIYLIKKISSDISTQTFHYDTDNRLIRFMSFRNDNLRLIHDYTYLDDYQRELSISAFENGETFNAIGMETFNQQHQPEKTFGLAINISNGIVDTDEEDNSFTYDETGRIAQWACHMNNELVAVADYELAKNGDIMEKKVTGILLPIDSKTTYEYDNQKHFTHYSRYGLSRDPIQHNITKYQQQSGQSSIFYYTSSFEYNEHGLPVKEIRVPNSGKATTYFYEYEER